MRRRARTDGLRVRRGKFKLAREAFAFGFVPLAENPNRVLHGSPRRADGEDHTVAPVTFTDAHELIIEHRPLTVATPLRDSRGRRNPRMGHSSYTI